jgi:hypothetical protein
MSDSKKNYVSENFGKFYSHIGRSLWKKDLNSNRAVKRRVAGNDTFHYTSDSELSKKDLEIEQHKISYEFNSHGFRSEEFGNSTSENYLYAGCSYTSGTGVPIDFIWASQLNKYIGGDKFFNLGVAGGSTHRIIVNILNYIKLYGAPKGIFILFPDLTRTDIFIENSRITVNTEKAYGNPKEIMSSEAEISKKVDEAKKVLTYERLFYDFSFSILNLEMLCQSMKIDLLWGVWDNQFNDYIIDKGASGFKNYVNILDGKTIEKVIREDQEYFNNSLQIPYWEKARDGKHPGTKAHSIYAKTFLHYFNNLVD